MNPFIFALLLLAGLAAQASPKPALPPLPDPMAPQRMPVGEPPERRVWAKVPIPVRLPVGRERMVSFPVPVRVGLPPELGGDILRTQIVDGTVYWVAAKEFQARRVEVQATASGNVYLLDLSAAQSSAAVAPIEISVPETPKAETSASAAKTAASQGQAANPATAQPSPTQPPKEQDYATLTRMASQHLYAPARLHRIPEGVRQVSVGRAGDDRLLRGGVAEATPVAAWRSGPLYVTAVKLRNLTGGDVVLDPRRLRGDWLTCAFQHARLSAHGDWRDTTSAYLISARPYEEALDGR
jgi:integrating conjugative element protein (TIGR03749 family)